MRYKRDWSKIGMGFNFKPLDWKISANKSTCGIDCVGWQLFLGPLSFFAFVGIKLEECGENAK